MKKRTATEKTYSVDELMRNVACTLVRDFRSNLDDPCFCSDFERALRSKSVAEVRQAVPALMFNDSIARFKATYQVASLMKRHRFEVDTYSDSELESLAIQGFLATQNRLANVDLDSLDAISNHVLDLAASYVADTLGAYCDEEHRDLCRFGRRASVGIPSRLACEAARWELPLSGSHEQISWFDSEMSQIACVQDYWNMQKADDPNRSTYQEIDFLTLTLVPKTFKSLRAIMPNTTVGSYMSFGLGEMIRNRLKTKGYDIKRLQHRHRQLASRSSVTGSLTTADLSSASDSITDALVRRLFPADWYSILSQSRIGQVKLPDNTLVQSLSFCTMGIGYTFPLQTLVFLSLLKAIAHVHFHGRGRHTISVYGDDLIYPSSMHKDVVRFFERFGFVINLDKTFHEGHFRESCGGDYYHGVDVRPFQPRNDQTHVCRRTYEAVLYKFTNGLLNRWSEYEIGKTLDFLLSEIESVATKVKVVPGDYPDEAGVKCDTLTSYEFLGRANVAKPVSIGHGIYRFSYLGSVSELREEKRHEPYYWLALRGFIDPYHHNGDGHDIRDRDARCIDRINDQCGDHGYTSILVTKEVSPIQTFRSLSGRRLRRTSTFVTISHTSRYTRRSGTSCFGSRR